MLQRSPSVVTRLRVTLAPLMLAATRWIGAAVLPIVLVVAGLVSVVLAAWQVDSALGYLAAGMACFVLEWRLDRERS